MKVHDLDSILQAHPFFKDLPESFLHAVAGCSKNVRYSPGDFLFREKGAADEFFLVREGQLALEDHRTVGHVRLSGILLRKSAYDQNSDHSS